MKKIKAKLSKQKLSTHNETREDARKVGRKIPPAPRDLFEPTLSENASYIAKTRYAFRNDQGEPIESPKEMFWRIASYIAAADTIYSKQSLRSSPALRERRDAGLKKSHLKSAREFYDLMAAQKFIPNTPTMVNSGKIGQSLSACFV